MQSRFQIVKQTIINNVINQPAYPGGRGLTHLQAPLKDDSQVPAGTYILDQDTSAYLFTLQDVPVSAGRLYRVDVNPGLVRLVSIDTAGAMVEMAFSTQFNAPPDGGTAFVPVWRYTLRDVPAAFGTWSGHDHVQPFAYNYIGSQFTGDVNASMVISADPSPGVTNWAIQVDPGSSGNSQSFMTWTDVGPLANFPDIDQILTPPSS